MNMREQMSIGTHIPNSQNTGCVMPQPVDYNKSSNSTMQSVPATSPIKREVKKSPKDFIFGKLIGEGSFSMVYLAKDVNSDCEYAIKVCDKRHIVKEKKQASIMREKKVLYILNTNPSPFFVKLYFTFQDIDRLYFALSYAKCGELLTYIKKVGSIDIPCAQFYAAEIVQALQHLHKLGIIHRDLKPENILLNSDMHIQITDFGSAKFLNQENVGNQVDRALRKNSFVGTAEYVSPELLTDKCASKSSDLWALGCILYQMIAGSPPFLAPNEYLIFQKILKLEYTFPEGFSTIAKSLIEKLLTLDPSKRLGYNDADGYPSIKSHKFFSGIDWSTLHEQTPPPILPFSPGSSDYQQIHSSYMIPDHLEPGLDEKQMSRLLGLELHDQDEVIIKSEESKSKLRKQPLLDISPADMNKRLELQTQNSIWHRFVQGNLILKQGYIDKRKGLFARRRMFLLTTGPRLFYVDPVNMVLKGEIPWSVELRPETKNFKTFFVHTPNRTYYLEDPEGYALEWCRVINEVHKSTYNNDT